MKRCEHFQRVFKQKGTREIYIEDLGLISFTRNAFDQTTIKDENQDENGLVNGRRQRMPSIPQPCSERKVNIKDTGRDPRSLSP